MLLLQPSVLATIAIVGIALVGVAILRLKRAQAGRTTPSARRGEPLAPTLRIDDLRVPAWVHRLHADGLPGGAIPSEAPSRPVSQRFIGRWHGVTSGY
jgi:hypothetical protein